MPFGIIMGMAIGRNGSMDEFYAHYTESGISDSNLALYLFGFVAINLLLYVLVNYIVKTFYGKHLKALEEVVEDIL
jgi:hypothetical protein